MPTDHIAGLGLVVGDQIASDTAYNCGDPILPMPVPVGHFHLTAGPADYGRSSGGTSDGNCQILNGSVKALGPVTVPIDEIQNLIDKSNTGACAAAKPLAIASVLAGWSSLRLRARRRLRCPPAGERDRFRESPFPRMDPKRCPRRRRPLHRTARERRIRQVVRICRAGSWLVHRRWQGDRQRSGCGSFLRRTS